MCNFILVTRRELIDSHRHFREAARHRFSFFLANVDLKKKKGRGNRSIKPTVINILVWPVFRRFRKVKKPLLHPQPHQSDPVGNPINPLVSPTQKAHLVDPRAFPPKEVN